MFKKESFLCFLGNGIQFPNMKTQILMWHCSRWQEGCFSSFSFRERNPGPYTKVSSNQLQNAPNLM